MTNLLFSIATFLGKPIGFYITFVVMLVSCIVGWFGMMDLVTLVLSVLAIVVSGIILIQNDRDMKAIHVKLDELLVATEDARNDLVDLEQQATDQIENEKENVKQEAA